MTSKFRSKLITEELMGSKFARLDEPFVYYSDLLKCEISIPAGFICDYESVPLIRATSKRGGVIHDYLCRLNSDPIVSKQMAAAVYKEAQNCRDQMLIAEKKKSADSKWKKFRVQTFRFNKWLRRNIKTPVVRVAWGYYHKFTVEATFEELKEKF
jgi:hypothetical protein